MMRKLNIAIMQVLTLVLKHLQIMEIPILFGVQPINQETMQVS